MKEYVIRYKVEGQVVVGIEDDVTLDEDYAHKKLSALSDQDIVNNLENVFTFSGIDKDAISVVAFEELSKKENEQG